MLFVRLFAAVAQLDRVLGYEPRGRGFDSCQPHQISIFSRLEHSLEAYASRLFFFEQTVAVLFDKSDCPSCLSH